MLTNKMPINHKISISVIIALLAQGAAATWWLSQVNTRLSVTEQWIHDHESSVDSIDQLEARLDGTKDIIQDINNRLNLINK